MKHKYLTRKLCLFICYFIGLVVNIALSEAATKGVLYKKLFLKSSQNSQEKTCATVFFNKFEGAADFFTYHLNLKIFEHSL